MNVIEPTIDYNFASLHLTPPSSIPGNAFFTRILNNNKPLYIQTPKCLTKSGFVVSGKKVYVDLMIESNDTVFIHWIEQLEQQSQELIFLKKDTWFETSLSKDDIESAFTSPLKVYKSGKYYLIRVNAKTTTKIYDEQDVQLEQDYITNDSSKHIISILEVQGIKFTQRNFQIEIELKQAMVVSPDPFLETCFIKKPISAISNYKKEDQPSMDTPLVKISKKEDNPQHLLSLIEDSTQEIINSTKSNSDITEPLEKTHSKKEIDSSEIHQIEEEINLDISTQANTFTNSQTHINTKDVLDKDDETISEPLEEINLNGLKDENNSLQEFDPMVSLETSLPSETINNIVLKDPEHVYYEIYKAAKSKAKLAKKAALDAYLEAQNIKKTYMLEDTDSETESNAEYSDNDDDDAVTPLIIN
jgi:hypothetical protein